MSDSTVIVLAQTRRWCSVIKQHFPDTRLAWVLDVPGLVNEARKRPGAAAIVELTGANVIRICEDLSAFANNSDQLLMLAVANGNLAGWRSLIRAAGFASSIDSPIFVPALSAKIARHHRSVVPTTTSIEQEVWRNLPWASAVSGEEA